MISRIRRICHDNIMFRYVTCCYSPVKVLAAIVHALKAKGAKMPNARACAVVWIVNAKRCSRFAKNVGNLVQKRRNVLISVARALAMIVRIRIKDTLLPQLLLLVARSMTSHTL